MNANSSASTSAPAPTPETLSRHELNGLSVRISDARNADAIGISGRVVSETERTLVIEGFDGVERQVPKESAIFEFALPDTDADGRPTGKRTRTRTHVVVEGARLIANPARRTERTRRSKWR